MRRIYVVEMWNESKARWEPTVGAALTQADSRVRVKHWRSRNPDDKFRVSLYVATEEGREAK